MATAQEAFSEAADRLNALALKLKMHYQEERSGEAGGAVRDALSRLGTAVEDVFEAVGDAARDEAVRADARDAARSVGDALATVFAQVGDDLRNCFKPKGARQEADGDGAAAPDEAAPGQ